MTFDEYQRATSRTRNHVLSSDDQLLDAAAGLAEEGGEVLSLVRKHRFQGRELDQKRLVEELGDALWCIATAASTLGISLEQIASANIEKLETRHPKGFVPPGR
ncbi:MAG TPA: nucleoside triphosphate pyrophosphohydrolase family protein [Gemmatimonadaceae bacterium]|nr:nucleoside triphosphate pyrophosphohydrolase family protein [Gemmatimonadaceae bacterium]